MKSVLFLLLLAALVLYATADPAPGRPIPNTIPRPPPIPPLRVRRGVKFPQPQRPQRPQPVPLPKPVPRPPPIPPLRLRRDVAVPQPQLFNSHDGKIPYSPEEHYFSGWKNPLLRNRDLLQPHLTEHRPLKIEVVELHETKNPPLNVKSEIGYPQHPILRPVLQPKPFPRPAPIRFKRDVEHNRPQRNIRPSVTLPTRVSPLILPLSTFRPVSPLILPLSTPIPPLRWKRSAQRGDTPFVPKWPYHNDNNPFKIPPKPVGGTPYINRPKITPFSPGRFRRSPDGWKFNPNLSRDQNGNTKGNVDISHHGENGDFHASWGQNLKGPNKHSETWSIGGTYNFP